MRFVEIATNLEIVFLANLLAIAPHSHLSTLALAASVEDNPTQNGTAIATTENAITLARDQSETMLTTTTTTNLSSSQQQQQLPASEQYFWERVYNADDCPLNCSAVQSASLQCWRLVGYLIPFICLPTHFDPNAPGIVGGNNANSAVQQHWWPEWMPFAMSNAELVILALLALNVLVGLATCICLFARTD